jgi:hypothetical protein
MICSSSVHCPNASFPISSKPSLRVTVDNLEQSRNAPSLIALMALGMLMMHHIDLHHPNTSNPISSSPPLRITILNWQSINALSLTALMDE